MAWVQLLHEPSEDGLEGFVKTKAALDEVLKEYEVSTNTHFVKKNSNIFNDVHGMYIYWRFNMNGNRNISVIYHSRYL